MSKTDIALIISLISLLIGACALYLHYRKYRSETKPRLKVSLARTNERIEVRALNPNRGPIVIERFGFEAAGKLFAIRMHRRTPGSYVQVPNSVKLEQNEAHVEVIGMKELSAILVEELGIEDIVKVRGMHVDSLSKVWLSAPALSIDTGEWWPSENGRRQTNKYGEQLWRNVTIVE